MDGLAIADGFKSTSQGVLHNTSCERPANLPQKTKLAIVDYYGLKSKADDDAIFQDGQNNISKSFWP
eukprot:scaffold390540_cov23-Prasinocladus_malaysianus.AAC.1